MTRRESDCSTPVTCQPVRIWPPFAVTLPATSSHICPGPNFGYMNRSMSEVSTDFCEMPSPLLGRRLRSTCSTALVIERPLMRCAPHSALICLQDTPHTFSVYDLKNVRYNSRPKRLMKKSSRLFSFLIGNITERR